jgi:hypothetical protein
LPHKKAQSQNKIKATMQTEMPMEERKAETTDHGPPQQPQMVIVTGYKRSGTSLMMAMVEKLGTPLHYCEDFEAKLRAGHGGKNDFYYEIFELSATKLPPGTTVWYDGAVKMFSHVLTHNVKTCVPEHLLNSSNVKIIWMRRESSKIERSIARYKEPDIPYVGPLGKSAMSLNDEKKVIAKLDDYHREAMAELPDMLTVNFEDLVRNPYDVAKVVAEYLEKPFDDSMVQSYLRLVDKDKVELTPTVTPTVTPPASPPPSMRMSMDFDSVTSCSHFAPICPSAVSDVHPAHCISVVD